MKSIKLILSVVFILVFILVLLSAENVSAQITFNPKVDFNTGTRPFGIAIGDLDGDGKPDLAIANTGNGTVSVLRNTSTGGTLSFAVKVDFTTGQAAWGVAIGDVDGDGKPDLAVTNHNDNTLSVFRNTSTIGTILFATKVDFAVGAGPTSIIMGDLDGDGKPDIAITNTGNGTVSVLRNISTSSTILFASKVDFATGTNTYDLAIGDLDGDNKPDLAVVNANSITVSVLRNMSTSGTISFAAKVDFATGTNPNGVALGDLDGDGKPDLVVANSTTASNTVWIMHNTSTSGSISFDPKVDFTTGFTPHGLVIGDLDGDGKLDLTVTNASSSTVSVLRNTSISGNILFVPKTDFGVGTESYRVVIGDLDGDGKPDLAVTNYGSNTVSVLRNSTIGLDSAAISGMKFNDLNGNGVQDANEPGISGWTITLSGNGITISTTTNLLGNYSFNNLSPGTYTVTEVQQSGWTSTTLVSQTVTLGSGQTVTVNFGNQQTCIPPPDSMVAWWPLDETSGTIADDIAGFNNVGTYFGNPTPVPGKVAGALRFNGTTDYVEVANQSELNFGTGDFSIDAWINPDAIPTVMPIVGKKDQSNLGYLFYLLFGRPTLILDDKLPPGGGTFVSSATIPVGEWTHVAVTVDRDAVDGVQFYVNGNFVDSFDPRDEQGSLDNAQPLWIGRSLISNFFNGTIDEVELFNRALDSTEVVAIWAADSLGKCKNPITLDCNSKTWSPLGSGMNFRVVSLSTIGTDLYVGGVFTTAGGVSANRIAKWNGSNWSALGSGMNDEVVAFTAIGTDLYASGGFTNAGGVSAFRIAKWDGTNWSALASGGMNNGVWTLAVIGTDLYAGGIFTTAGGVNANHIAKWDGTSWSALGSGLNGEVWDLAVIGTNLYVVGNFTTAGGISANNIAKWNGTNWSALGSGLNGIAFSLAVIGTDIYAGGDFTSAGGVSANRIAKWDGTSWSALGSGINANVEALAVIGANLYAGGVFSTAGGVSANRIAKWDGTSWSALRAV